MTPEILILLLLIGVTLVVFVLEQFPVEVTALGLLGALLLLGYIDVEQAVAGLSNKAVVTIGAMFILSHSLAKTGLLETAADRLGRMVGPWQWTGIAILLVTVSVTSAFLTNTAVVAIFVPLAVQLCNRFDISPSKVLLPLSYVAIAGGTLTLIGTSTNLIISAFLSGEEGQAPVGMFEFARLGWLYVVVVLAYVLLLARRLLPVRSEVKPLVGKYHMGAYLTELRILKDSPLAGKSCKQVGMNEIYDITALAILRGEKRYSDDVGERELQTDDILIVRGMVDNIMRLRKEQRVALLSDIKLSDSELAEEGEVLAEGLVTSTSRLLGRTLRQIDFRRRYGTFVLAIRHHQAILREKIANIPLRFSDTLLMLAPRERLNELRRSEDLIIISEVAAAFRRERFWWVVILIIPVLMILVASGVVDILKGALLGVLLLLLLRAVDIREAYRAVDWSVLFLIAAFVPVGMAMTQTGTAAYVGSGILSLINTFPAHLHKEAAIALVYLGTMTLTQVVSNNATAIILAPIAITISGELGTAVRPFLITVAFASSAGFMTPIAYQTNLMVYGPGNYRFMDYVRFGALLSLVLWLLSAYFIPRLWAF